MVYILLAPGFEEAEALVPADLLRRARVETALVGVEALAVPGGHGITVTADCVLSQVDLAQADMLVLPGGMGGVNAIRACAPALELIRTAHAKGVKLAAICAAPTILAGLGLLDGRSAVCYPGMEGEMASADVRPGTPVVVDGSIITAEAAGSAFPFGLALVEALKGPAAAQEVYHAVHCHH